MPETSFHTAVLEFAEAVAMLMRRKRAAGARQELSWSETAVLKRLAVDGPATTAELARAQGMKPQSMGTILASLEELGMIERKPHAFDRRQMTISLTEKGAETQRSVGEAKRTWLAQAIGQLDGTEQKTLFEAGRILRRMLEPSGKRAED